MREQNPRGLQIKGVRAVIEPLFVGIVAMGDTE
jgi:hypothetical protein